MIQWESNCLCSKAENQVNVECWLQMHGHGDTITKEHHVIPDWVKCSTVACWLDGKHTSALLYIQGEWSNSYHKYNQIEWALSRRDYVTQTAQFCPWLPGTRVSYKPLTDFDHRQQTSREARSKKVNWSITMSIECPTLSSNRGIPFRHHAIKGQHGTSILTGRQISEFFNQAMNQELP